MLFTKLFVYFQNVPGKKKEMFKLLMKKDVIGLLLTGFGKT